jgi:hypothetical protein
MRHHGTEDAVTPISGSSFSTAAAAAGRRSSSPANGAKNHKGWHDGAGRASTIAQGLKSACFTASNLEQEGRTLLSNDWACKLCANPGATKKNNLVIPSGQSDNSKFACFDKALRSSLSGLTLAQVNAFFPFLPVLIFLAAKVACFDSALPPCAGHNKAHLLSIFDAQCAKSAGQGHQWC